MNQRVVLISIFIAAVQVGSAWAHENTLAANTQSLISQAVPPPSKESPIGPRCKLRLNLIDAATKEPLPGLVRIIDAAGNVQALNELFNRGTGLGQSHASRQWSIVLESATLSVPREKVTIEAFSGLETELAVKTVDLTGRSSAEAVLALVRFHDASENGWRSGNTHLHLRSLTRAQADQYLSSISRADGLELVFVSYLRRAKAESSYISNIYTEEQLQQLSGDGVTFSFGEEHRHNFGSGGEGYGHVMFLNIKELIRPVSIGSGIMGEGHDWPPVRRGIDKARRDGATTIWCHNAFGFEEVPDWIAGVLDAHNIFDGGSRGSYADTFYRFMDIGLRVPFSTGTDWFIYDFSRVYVEVHEPLTVDRWLDGLENGRTFITNGPLLELSLGKHRPGDIVRLMKPRELRISASAAGRCDFEKLEVIYNGRVVQLVPSRPAGGHFEARIDAPLRISEPGWIALRVSPKQKNELGEPLFGHTSAVYVELAGKTVFKPEVARELISDMNQAMRTIREKASFADEKQTTDVLQVYRKGIANLRRRLEKQ